MTDQEMLELAANQCRKEFERRHEEVVGPVAAFIDLQKNNDADLSYASPFVQERLVGFSMREAEVQSLRARVAELEDANAELEKDRERLDWLEATPHVEWDMTMEGGIIEVGDDYFHCDTIRQAIDAARKEAEPPAGDTRRNQ